MIYSGESGTECYSSGGAVWEVAEDEVSSGATGSKVSSDKADYESAGNESVSAYASSSSNIKSGVISDGSM